MTATAIINARIYAVDEHFSVFKSGSIVMEKDLITAIGDADSVDIPADAEIIDGKDRLAVLPGLIDAHSHSSLLKGFTENAQLMDWLPEYQREHQVLTEQDAYFSCLANYMEALKGGTTLVMDMYRYLHKAAKAAGLLGLRVELVPYAADHPTKHFFETLETSEQLIRDCQGMHDDRVRTWVGLEHITYCSEQMFRDARDLADKYQVSIHTHSSEQSEEVDLVIELFGDRPIHKFHDWGILKPGTVLAHCVFLDKAEIELVAVTGTHIAHCPLSNMKLAGGAAPIQKFWDAGISVGLGSDGAICNNSVSMWECMKVGSLLQKVTHCDATAVSARQALRMATIEGAKALGRDRDIGSLEVGKQADLITVDLWQPHLMPIVESEGHDPLIWNLVFAGRASDVQDVWVAGQQVVKQGQFTLINEDSALQDIQAATIDFLARREKCKAVPMV